MLLPKYTCRDCRFSDSWTSKSLLDTFQFGNPYGYVRVCDATAFHTACPSLVKSGRSKIRNAMKVVDLSATLTPHIIGGKKQSDEGAALFAVRVHVTVIPFLRK
jgi:hypothetical protein